MCNNLTELKNVINKAIDEFEVYSDEQRELLKEMLSIQKNMLLNHKGNIQFQIDEIDRMVTQVDECLELIKKRVPSTQLEPSVNEDGSINWNLRIPYEDDNVRLELKNDDKNKFVITYKENHGWSQVLTVNYQGITRVIQPNTSLEFEIVEGDIIIGLDDRGELLFKIKIVN